MRLFVKCLIVVLIVALGAPFFLRGPDGEPLMRPDEVADKARLQWQRLWSDGARSVRDVAERAGFETADPVIVYRWRDAQGQWHYTDAENAPAGSEAVVLDPDSNTYRPAPLPAGGGSATSSGPPGERARAARDAVEQRQDDVANRSSGD